ncbi:jg22796, partial [Pararge aegeria aegeria]
AEVVVAVVVTAAVATMGEARAEEEDSKFRFVLSPLVVQSISC